MNSSGTTALATNGAASIQLLSNDNNLYTNFVFVMYGTANGSISFDGGNNWGFVPGAISSTQPTTISLQNVKLGKLPVLFQRITGTDCTGIYAWMI